MFSRIASTNTLNCGHLGEDFKKWFTDCCGVYATLVDRIVPGFPRKEIKDIQQKICYEDNLVVQAEIFHLWVIEAPKEIAEEFPQTKPDCMFCSFRQKNLTTSARSHCSTVLIQC